MSIVENPTRTMLCCLINVRNRCI